MRTISHEWAHAFDKENLNIKDRRSIGGESENFANSISGTLVKKFVKSNPKLNTTIYS